MIKAALTSWSRRKRTRRRSSSGSTACCAAGPGRAELRHRHPRAHRPGDRAAPRSSTPAIRRPTCCARRGREILLPSSPLAPSATTTDGRARARSRRRAGLALGRLHRSRRRRRRAVRLRPDHEVARRIERQSESDPRSPARERRALHRRTRAGRRPHDGGDEVPRHRTVGGRSARRVGRPAAAAS